MVNSPIEPAAEAGIPDFVLKEDAARRISINVAFVLAFLLACASVVLCALWGSYDGPGFLGRPDAAFESNLVSWHAILLVCGFFFAQVMALTVTGVFPASSHAELKGKAFIYHLFWMLVAAAALKTGNQASSGYNKNVRLPNTQSVHTWYGVATVVMYAINFVLALISPCIRVVKRSYSFKAIRVLARIFAFLLTVVSVATGIMLYQGETGCFTRKMALPLPAPDYNPAAAGCCISNGLGVAVAAAALCTVYFMGLCYDSWQDQAGRRQFLAGMEAHALALARGLAPAETASDEELTGKLVGLYRTHGGAFGMWLTSNAKRMRVSQPLTLALLAPTLALALVVTLAVELALALTMRLALTQALVALALAQAQTLAPD